MVFLRLISKNRNSKLRIGQGITSLFTVLCHRLDISIQTMNFYACLVLHFHRSIYNRSGTRTLPLTRPRIAQGGVTYYSTGHEVTRTLYIHHGNEKWKWLQTRQADAEQFSNSQHVRVGRLSLSDNQFL